MGMDVSAVAGYGIIIFAAEVDEDFDGVWPAPKGLICTQVGAYLDDRVYFLGAGGEVGWNAGVDGKPIQLPDLETIKEKIKTALAAADLSADLYSDEKFGFHVYPSVS